VKLLVISLVFPPDNVSTAHIIGDLADELARSGMQVHAITTVPHYNAPIEDLQDLGFKKKWFGLLWERSTPTNTSYHIAVFKKDANWLKRALSWGIFHLLTIPTALLKVRRADLILCPSPPLTNGLVGIALGCLLGARVIYNVQEIYPDVAIALGYLRRPALIRFWFWIERLVYRKVDAVTVIAEAMRANILQKGFSEAKIQLIPNFVDVKQFEPLAKVNPFTLKHGWADKFVVSYAGNIGVAQELDSFLDAAKLLQNEPRILFTILGEGVDKERIYGRVRSEHIANVQCLPFQSYDLMPQIYSGSDLSLVCLASSTGAETLPSKIFRILACGKPILGCGPKGSDLESFVQTHRCGVCVEPGRPEFLADAIRKLYRNPALAAELGDNGLKAVRASYTREAVAQSYRSLAERLLA
jgi:colanic acid biosynthesis glycosyl transferase WcaI